MLAGGEGDDLSLGKNEFLASAGDEEAAGGPCLYLEGAETGDADLFVLPQAVSHSSQDGIQRELGGHGGGGATQLLAHEFL